MAALRRRSDRRAAPRFDPDLGDRALTVARHDIAIGRWQGVRDLLRATGENWPLRSHRVRAVAGAAAGSSIVEAWRAAEPNSPDAAVLRAATEVTRVFNGAIAAGRGAGTPRDRVDAAVRACLRAAATHPTDPTPWASLLTVVRLYEGGVARRELRTWWDELRRRDPYHLEGHIQMLRYFSARWHGTHGSMYDFARDAAGAAPAGSPLPVLVQIARVEEYRYVSDAAKGRPVRGFGQHWTHELAVTELHRTYDRWLGGRPPGPARAEEAAELNYLAHAASCAGLAPEAGALVGLLGERVATVPWVYTGDPAQQILRWRGRAGDRSPRRT